MTRKAQEGYIIEFITLKGSVKVTALDPVTLKEVSLIGAPNIPQKQLAELAIRKLHYVLNKDKDPD